MRIPHLIAVLIATFVLIASNVRAQGTSGQVPEPISTGDLHRLLQRYVQPTKAQWDAIESLHDDYREAFRQLRETEIEKFMGEMAGLQKSGVPSPKAIEEFLRKYDRVTKRIEEVDGTLLDGIAAIVGDEKRAAVERTRDARARARDMSSNMSGGMGMSPSIDLSEIALDGLENEKDGADVRAIIDPTLITYEKRLTTLTHALGDQSRHMMVDLVKELEKQGFANLSQDDFANDPERVKQLMETMQAVWKSVGAKVAKVSGDMRDLHAKTFKSLMSQLQGDAARRLRSHFIGKMHPELGWQSVQPERIYRSLLRSSRLDAEAKARLKTEYDAWAQADDAIVDSAMREDDEWAKSRSPMDFNQEHWAEHNKAVQDVRTKREELGRKSIEGLRAIVGNERFEKIQAQAMASAKEDLFADTGDPDADMPDVAVSAQVGPNEPAQFEFASGGTTAITVATVQSFAASMKLDDASKATLETLHTDYLKRWEEEVKPVQEEMTKAQQGMWVQPEGDVPWHVDAARQSAYYEKRRAVAERAGVVDDAMFDDAGKALGDAHSSGIHLAKLNRAIERYTRPNEMAWSGSFFGNGQEQPVNLVRLVEQASIPDDLRAKAFGIVLERADVITNGYRESYFEGVELERQIQDMQTKWQEKASAEGDSGAGAAASLGVQMVALQQKLGDVATRRAKMCDEIFAAILEVVGDEHKQRLQFEHDKTAYPTIFNDARSVLPMIDKAADMSDLTDDQRTQLKALREGYEKEYMDACRRMVPKRIEAKGDARPEERFVESMAQHNVQAKIQFERDERSARAASQLRRLLNEEQAKRIPNLIDYEKSLPTGESRRFY